MRGFHWLIGSSLLAAFGLWVGCTSLPSFNLEDFLPDSGDVDDGDDADGDDTDGDDTGDDDDSPVDEIFPEDLELEIDELPDDTTELAAKGVHEALGEDYTGVRRTILTSANIVNSFHRLANRSLALARRVRFFLDDPSQTQVSGQFLSGGQTVEFKADFGAFDVDGDGNPDGSGNAFDLPVAVRIWVDRGEGYERFLCALIDQRPSDSNLGSGRMWAHPAAANGSDREDFQFFVRWDRTNDAHKWNEAYLSGAVNEYHTMSIGLQRVDVRTYEDGSVEKTVRSNSSFSESVPGFSSFVFSTHFRRGEPYALASAQSTGGRIEVDFSQVCVDLSMHSLATGGECDSFDLTDFDFLTAPGGSETQFPAAFEESPSF